MYDKKLTIEQNLTLLAATPSLQAFTVQRAELLAILRPLPPESWSRKATVTGAGKPRERTVHTYAQWLANHEQFHMRQFERIVKAPFLPAPIKTQPTPAPVPA